jgi:uncharacterized Fe-S cluster-containing protein
MNETQFIHLSGGAWEYIREPLTALAVTLKSIPTTHHNANIACALIAQRFAVAGERLSIETIELRLWIKQVHLAGATIHE